MTVEQFEALYAVLFVALIAFGVVGGFIAGWLVGHVR